MMRNMIKIKIKILSNNKNKNRYNILVLDVSYNFLTCDQPKERVWFGGIFNLKLSICK